MATYQGKKVTLNKPSRITKGEPGYGRKKSKVYVKNKNGKVIKVIQNFCNVSKTLVDEIGRGQEKSIQRNEKSNKTITKLQLELQKLLEETPSIVDQLYGTDEDESDAENKLDERLRRIKSLTER